MPFVRKSVNATSRIGDDLRELREQAGWTRSQIAFATHIQESLILAWEEERWEEILDPAYSERILRAYVAFLHGKESYYLEKYRACLHEHKFERKTEELLPRSRKIRWGDLAVTSRWIALGGFLLFALGLGGYIYLQAHQIGVSPSLSVQTPTDGMKVKDPVLTVRGKTEAEANVLINDQEALVQPDGTFVFNLNLPRGTTFITVSARRRYGRSTEIVRRVIYDEPLPSFFFTTSTATSTN